jgi:RNA polymerase sigma-70 factor (ECF subfamily)
MARLHTPSDLVDDARAGVPGASAELLDACLPVVVAWCRRMGGPRVEAEDAAHDALLVVLTRLDRLEDSARFDSWLYGITRRTLAAHRRRSWVKRWASAVIPEAVDQAPNPQDETLATESAREVRALLDRLPARLREVLVMCDVEERTDQEAADLLAVPLGTVKSRLRHARGRFRSMALRQTGLISMSEIPSWGQG